MAKHISKKKKKGRVIISSESIADETETIPVTPEADLQKDDVIPPEVSIAKTDSVEAQTSDIFVNISNMDASDTVGEDASHVEDKVNLQMLPQTQLFLYLHRLHLSFLLHLQPILLLL